MLSELSNVKLIDKAPSIWIYKRPLRLLNYRHYPDYLHSCTLLYRLETKGTITRRDNE